MKKEVQEYITELLSYFYERFPNGNHTLTINDSNNLILWIQLEDKFQSVIFDEEYEDITPKKLYEDIIELFKNWGLI